jgi:acyl-CoA synthetase (AMP-forming)/AMP-acid ligase II
MQTMLRSPAMCDWVFEHARRDPDAPAVDSPDHRLSYGLLARRVAACSDALRRSGVRPGDKVVLALPNVPAAVVLALAVQHLGAVSVEVSRDWSVDRLTIVLAQTSARAVAFAARDAKKMIPLLQDAGVGLAVCVGSAKAGQIAMTDAGEIGGAAEDLPSQLPARDPDAVTLLLYTSGSTGQPRAVMQTMRNIAENARSIVSYLALTARDRAMLILPLSYCYGRSVLQTHLLVGGSVFLDRRFTFPSVVLAAIGSERCTGFAGVPLTFELLRRQAHPESRSMPSLRYVTQAGGPMSPETIDWARRAFDPAKLVVMYGQTEATARLSYLPPERAAEKRGSIGIPIPNVELRVVDDAGRELPPGSSGNLVARGPNVTPGYFEAPEDTAAVLRNGWLWTGDLAYRDDDGFFYIVGRAKEILKIAGYRVTPAQIEKVLCEHAGVEEVAVAGIEDALTGEASAALVVLRHGAAVTPRDLQRFCGERLAHPLVPRIVRLVRALPRSDSGKLLRSEVARSLRLPDDEATL